MTTKMDRVHSSVEAMKLHHGPVCSMHIYSDGVVVTKVVVVMMVAVTTFKPTQIL